MLVTSVITDKRIPDWLNLYNIYIYVKRIRERERGRQRENLSHRFNLEAIAGNIIAGITIAYRVFQTSREWMQIDFI